MMPLYDPLLRQPNYAEKGLKNQENPIFASNF